MKQHLDEDDLILHFYGETGAAAEPHLASCPDCRERFHALQRVLNSVDLGQVPHRGAEYGEEVWNRLAPKLEPRRWWANWIAHKKWIPILAAAALMLVAFFAGRYSPRADEPAVTAGREQVRERVLVVAVGGHLERSKLQLAEIANANPESTLDWMDQRGMAEDLVYTNRLYRQTALSTGDARTAGLLEELERVLIEISHSPDDLSGVRLQGLRERIRGEGLIFKIRVAGSKLAQGEVL